MSDDLNKHGQGSDEFEREDLSPGAIYAFLIGLAVAGFIVYFGLKGLYYAMDRYEQTHQPPQNPLVQQVETNTRIVTPDEVKRFPSPRLETNERLEINNFRLQEEQRLNSYGWVDQQAGVVHIPIERAMELIARQGLPTTPKVGEVPPGEVNTVNQAAAQSDSSKASPPAKQHK
jgi:hypothetical protein